MTLSYEPRIGALEFLRGPVLLSHELTPDLEPSYGGQRAWIVKPTGRGNNDPRPNRWRATQQQLVIT